MNNETFNIEYIQNLSPEMKLRTIHAVTKASQSFLYSWSILYDFLRLNAFIMDPKAASWAFEIPDGRGLAMVRFLTKLKQCNTIKECMVVQDYCATYYHNNSRTEQLRLSISLDDLQLIKQLMK